MKFVTICNPNISVLVQEDIVEALRESIFTNQGGRFAFTDVYGKYYIIGIDHRTAIVIRDVPDK